MAFYVKLTDIDRDLSEMFISDSFSTSGYTYTADRLRHFGKSGQIKWCQMAMERIRDAFFLNEGETAVVLASPDTSISMVKLNQRSWYQNMMFEPAEVALDTTGERDHKEQMSAFDMITQMQMTELTYEKYLEQYGVQSMNLGIGEPEILRFSRSWTKPVNHIDPTDGTPSSAWVWNDEMKIEKDKRFDEPGFIVMCAAIRPKMFQKAIEYPMIGNLWGSRTGIRPIIWRIRRRALSVSARMTTCLLRRLTRQRVRSNSSMITAICSTMGSNSSMTERTHTPSRLAMECLRSLPQPPLPFEESILSRRTSTLSLPEREKLGAELITRIVGLTIAGHVTDTTL